ncbi:MAG TPA: hypothetical protein VMD56_02330 [Steroidobacteraceae bacterium]|nr:hypothetical protein [Steroidobacteraceae bacterium]
MRSLLYFLLFLILAAMVTTLAIILGYEGPWYFAWLIGTTMIVLVSAAGGAMLDAQEEQSTDATRSASDERQSV